MTTEREQKLVDICFAVGLMIHSASSRDDTVQRDHFHKMTREEVADWIAQQLDGCGFPTKQIGSSWGVLK